MKRPIKKILFILIIVIIFLSILPFFLKIDETEIPNQTPYSNSNFLYVDEIMLHYRIFEPDQIIGKVLLVHGLGASTFSFRNNIDTLIAEGFLVVAVDLPGFGYSDRKKNIDHSQKSRSILLWQLLDEIDADYQSNNQWHLVGHSMGGGTVVAMSIDRSDEVASITLISGAVLRNKLNYSFLFKNPFIQRWFKVIYSNILTYEEIESILQTAYGRKPSEEEVLGHLIPLKFKGSPRTLVDMTITAKNEPIELLKDLNVPILLIWGDNDTVVPVSDGYEVKRLLPESELRIIDNAYHCAMETHYEIFNQLLIGFLKED